VSERYIPLEQRFWENVRIGPDCWEWAGSRLSGGYGGIRVGGKTTRALRLSWEIHNGPIPDGLFVLHHCDNPPCVKPEHLFLGDDRTNAIDRNQKGRQWITHGTRNGQARLTESQVGEIRGSTDSERVLASRYGVHHSTIHRIRSGRSWRALLRRGVGLGEAQHQEVGE
jgi:hypothetical protein